MKPKYIFTILILLFSISIFSQDILNKHLETAAKNNPLLKAKFSEYMAVLEKIPQVNSLPDPQLAFGIFILPVETKNGAQQFKLSLSQMFPWFGTLSNKEDIIIQKAKAKYENFEDKKSKLFYLVKSSYYNLYFIQEAIKITKKNIKFLETFKSLALIKIESGKASGVDELRVEMKLADIKNSLELLNDKLSLKHITFNNLLNIDNKTITEIPDSITIDKLKYSKQEILDSIKYNNHQILSLDFIIESFKQKEKLATKEGNPNITLGLDYTAIGENGMENSGNDALMFKIGFTLPVFRDKYTAKQKEASLMQESISNSKANKINELKTIFEKVYLEFIDANRRIKLYTNQYSLSERALKILESEYISSGKNFEEILRMEKFLLKYTLEVERAKVDNQISIAFINYLMGSTHY